MTEREKIIELLERVPQHQRLYPDLYVDMLIANGVTFATDNNVGDKMTPTWIPVTERLPKLETYVYSVDVLFYVPYENIYVGYVNFESGTWKCKHSRELFAADKVTHWMPLPEPPKGE